MAAKRARFEQLAMPAVNALYRQAEGVLEQEMPVMPIYFYVRSRLLKADVQGFPLHNPEDKVYSKDLYIIAR